MDLVGRKLAQNGGRAVQAFFKLVAEEAAAAKDDEALAGIAGKLEKALGELQAATLWFMGQGMQNPNPGGQGAHPYMHQIGSAHVRTQLTNVHLDCCLQLEKKKH